MARTPTDGVVDRVSARIDDLRDTTASALSADDAPSLRELGRVRRRLDDVEDRLAQGLAALTEQQAELAGELRASRRRTTLPRRAFWLLLGGAAAAVGTWLADPDRGRARRARLADQVGAQARELGDRASSQAGQVLHRAQGAVIEAGKGLLPEDVPDDPALLQQRVRSQVLGHRDDTVDVVLTIGEPGQVILKGTVPSPEAEQELVDQVRAVEGVVEVESRLAAPDG